MSTAARDTAARLDPSDLLDVDALLSDEERLIRDTVRAFVTGRVLPGIDEWFERGVFPREMALELGGLGLLGMRLRGHGWAGPSAVAYGMACMELAAGDLGCRGYGWEHGLLDM